MTDDFDDSQDSDDASQPLASPRGGHPWLKPLLFFAIALACGTLASGLWLWKHPKPATPTPSEAVVTSSPDHRPLPAPMAGGTTDLPAPASPAPDAPHIVSAAPDAANASPATDSTPADAGASPAEATQETPPPASGTVAEGGDSDPQVVERSQPQYPIDALRERAEGEVRVQVSLDAQGKVINVHLAASSGTPALDRAAMDAARSWRYKPAMHDGQAVAGTLDVPLDFRLDPQN